jgi:hypothetical protein
MASRNQETGKLICLNSLSFGPQHPDQTIGYRLHDQGCDVVSHRCGCCVSSNKRKVANRAMLRGVRNVIQRSSPQISRSWSTLGLESLHKTKTSLRFSSQFFQKKQFSTRLYDELEEDRLATVVLTSKIDPDDPMSHEIYRYDIDFKATCSDVQYAQEGAYIDLTPAEMEKYLPEGGSGEMAAEMKTTRKNAFMVREASKLVCRSHLPSSSFFSFSCHSMIEFLMTLLTK